MPAQPQRPGSVNPQGSPAPAPPASFVPPVKKTPETPTERHARRVAWGHEWGAVGKAWKAEHNPKGK